MVDVSLDSCVVLTPDDVSDYRDVDPNIGTLADFDEMMTAFKSVGIKVIIDIVPNHTGNEHKWFQAALASKPGSIERARFHFQDGKSPSPRFAYTTGTGTDKSSPPNDWDCLFGGSAWEPVGDGQYYFHMFDSSQPDLNWDNEEVRQDFLMTLRFWADRGVSGFRVDVAMAMAKDLSQPFASKEELAKLEALVQVEGKQADFHPFWDRDETLEIFKDWRKVFNEYDPPLTYVQSIRTSGADRIGP
jgi:alpha-glucosidase